MKVYTLLLCFFCSILIAQGQDKDITVKGKVLEGNSRQPIEFATVFIADPESGGAIIGTTTDLDGHFQIKNSTSPFYLEIRFIGFESQKITGLQLDNQVLDLGEILLYEDAQQLDEITVRAEKSTTEFKLDKRVFNVGKDLSSTGASVLEVLNNVPSVNVNIEGDISLRGSSGVQILINGKPSVLASEQGNALGSITAEMIDKIEVITNPSAKYDAEGTSGIINIVIKKEERKGLNGSATVNVGVPHNHSFGLSLNRRTEKFNLFSQLGVGYRLFPSESENINRDLIANTELRALGDANKYENFYNLILGTDYLIDKNNVITLSGSFAYEIEDENSLTNFEYQNSSQELERGWSRSEITEAINPKFQYELQYKRDFKNHKDHTLLFSALGHFFGKDQSSQFEHRTTFGELAANDQQIETDFKEGKYTFKLDYTNPISDKFTIETGAQYLINNVSNDYEVLDFIDNEWLSNQSLTNTFNYDQNVLGVYGTGAYEGERWGIKMGLRMENTDLKTLLVTTNEVNNQNFTNLFPSVHTSFKLTQQVSFQAGYSRRIFRPRLWDLNPFFNIRNNFSIRTGNPNLLPEFSDSYELSSIFLLNKASFNATIYHRYTTDVVERVSTFENNINTAMPMNIGTKKSTGLEINGKIEASKKLTFTGDINYNYFNRQGSLQSNSFDFDANQWSSKITTKIKFPADVDFEVTGQYRSKYITIQSEISDQLFADFGLRKKIMKGKAVLNLSVRDIFASRIRESVTDQNDFYLYNYGRRGRFVTLGFSYGFGKGEAMEFSSSKRHH